MKSSDKILCAIYGLIAVGALFATWSQNLAFFALPDNGGLAGFIRMSYANPAAASITNDIVFVCFAIFAFMLVEARRLGMKHVWLYIVLSCCIAISVMLPLFLLARQRKLALA
ncbi:MAG: DUF2834 domain-containing protein [Moraxellaceae bacterium]